MARRATVLRQIVDVWGDTWDVREERDTPHGWPVCLGWPTGMPRGRGSGGPRVVITTPLAEHFERHRMAPGGLSLPIGSTAIKRIRRLLGHHRAIDAAAWWEDRAADLAELTIEQFARRHGRSVGAIVNARHALFGPRLRPAEWWRSPDVISMLLANRPSAAVADDLGISAGSVRRLRMLIRGEEQPDSA